MLRKKEYYCPVMFMWYVVKKSKESGKLHRVYTRRLEEEYARIQNNTLKK